MSGGWPSSIDPVQLAEKGAYLTGELPLTAMPRLLQACPRSSGSVNIDLRFERNQPNGLRFMYGTVHAIVRTTCQRCLQDMALEVHTEPRLILLRPDEREDLERDGETLVVGRPVLLSALVEDELLLALPMTPMHEAPACPGKGKADKPATGRRPTRRPSPFSVLSRLKRNDR